MGARRLWNKVEAMEYLKKHYYDESHRLGFASPLTIQMFFGKALSKKCILDFLRRQHVYASKFSFRKPRHNPMYVYSPRARFELDHVDLSELGSENDGFKFLLLATDGFSKYCWVEPQRDLSTSETIRALKAIVYRLVGRKRLFHVYTDRGSCFTSGAFKAALGRMNIRIHHDSNSTHMSFAERCVRTLKRRLYMYLSAKRGLRYLDDLPSIMQGLNAMPRRVLETSPGVYLSPQQAEKMEHWNDIRRFNEKYRYSRNYVARKPPKNDIEVGSFVFIRMLSSPFHKEHEGLSSKVLYEVSAIHTRMPERSFSLIDAHTREAVLGTWYRAHLSPYNGDVFPVRRIHGTRKRGRKLQVLVEWSHDFPDNSKNARKYYQWVDQTQMLE